METDINIQVVTNGVKSATEFVFDYNDGIMEDNGYKVTVTYFDENGYETECMLMGLDGEPVFKSVYSYYEPGRPSEKKFFNLLAEAETVWTYIYDSNNKLIRKTSVDKNSGNLIEEFTYDPEGRILEEITYSPSLPGGDKKHYEYSSEDGLLRRNKFSGDLLLSTYIEEMSSSGRKTEKISFNEDGSVDEREITEYNTKNQPLKRIKSTGPEEQLSISIYKYDEYDRLIEENSTGEFHSFALRLSYDSNGNVSDAITFYGNGEPQFHTKLVYEYY